jgi:hypothetical protein
MGATATDERTDIASTLDFEPQCAVTEWNNGVMTAECPNPAAWIGIPPCGHEDYFCEGHHSDQRAFNCNTCGSMRMHLATYRWIRL